MPFAEDYSAFFQKAEFAREGQFLPPTGPGRTTTGILEWSHVELNGEAQSRRPVWTCPESEVAGIKRGHKLKVGKQTFTIKDFERDGGGVIYVILSSNDS